MGQRKILFADHLRGIAALAVLVSHLVVPYLKNAEIADHRTISSALNVGSRVIEWLGKVDLGAFGVALFFLISGFVIPRSFKRHNVRSFLRARVLRIWPTYLAALACSIGVGYVSSWFWSSQFHISWGDLIANVLLIQDFVGSNSLDGVNWTLTLEVIFYLILIVIYPILLRYRAWFVAYCACVLPVMLVLQALFPVYLHLDLNFVKLGTCLPFMLIGTLFYLQMEDIITTREMFYSAVFSVYAIATCLVTVLTTPITAISYSAAFILFFGSFVMRERIGPSNILSSLSAISYPLYLVHSIIGFSIVRFGTIYLGLSYTLSLIAAVIGSLIVACALHFTVERPSMLLGSRLAPQSLQVAIIVEPQGVVEL